MTEDTEQYILNLDHTKLRIRELWLTHAFQLLDDVEERLIRAF